MFLYSELVVELALGDGTRGECVSGQLEALLEVPLVEDSTTPAPRPSSQYTDTTQPLPPLPGEQDDQPYSSQYAHYHADPSLSYDHTHITSSTDQQSPQPDSVWYLN